MDPEDILRGLLGVVEPKRSGPNTLEFIGIVVVSIAIVAGLHSCDKPAVWHDDAQTTPNSPTPDSRTNSRPRTIKPRRIPPDANPPVKREIPINPRNIV